ncbi:hypothetical protein [Dehalococcoides mccartyi]|nr:hypothetical protein [Dehalococcoides mccartyi]
MESLYEVEGGVTPGTPIKRYINDHNVFADNVCAGVNANVTADKEVNRW